MASKPYFVVDRGCWYVKWKAGPAKWKAQRLCSHPGWSKTQRPPKRPPPEAVRLARVWEERETRVKQGLEVDPQEATPLRTFLDDYILHAEAGQAEGSIKVLRRAAAKFVAWCDDQGVKTLPEVTAATCRSYLAQRGRDPGMAGVGRSGKTLAYKTLHTERGVLSPAWTQAFQDGRIVVNPWLRAPVPGKPRESIPPFWTEDEIERLTAACRPWLRDVVLVGVNTGLRITALLGLEWRDVSFEAGMVTVRAELDKAGRGYRVPMSAVANSVLGRRWTMRMDANPLVFPGPRKGKKVPSNRTFQAISRVVRRVGITNHGRFNHMTRHTFATHAVMRGVPLKVVSSWLGHSSIAMTEKYGHVIPEDSQRYMDKFDMRPGQEQGGQPPSPAP